MSYRKVAEEIGELVELKNEKYGDSFRKSGGVLQVLYPDGVLPEQYDDMLAVVRVIDKMFRIATERDALGESPWEDICGYALLRTAQIREVKK